MGFPVEGQAVAGKKLFTEAEEARIKNAIIAAEKNSAVEIVPFVTESCDSYPAVFWRMAIFLSFLIGGFLVYFQPHWDSLWILCLQSLGLPLAFLLRYSSFLSRLFLDDYDSKAEVHERTLQIFHELGIHRTRKRTGILLFVALFERRVEIVCDTGIEEKIARPEWEKITAALAAGIRQGNLPEALAHAILAAGDLARPLFPGSKDDENELGDELVRK